jgi:hypothetical protein
MAFARRHQMKRIIAAGRCVGVLAFALLVTANAARAQASSSFGNSSIEILYELPRSIKYLPLVHRLQSFRMLEQLSEFRAPVRLPHELLLLTHECGFVNAYYTTDAQYAPLWWRIDICYEFIEGLEHMGPRQGETSAFTYEEAVVGALVGVVLHECGHAAFDMLDVPVMGREEDAADQVAAFLALQFSKDVAPLVIRGIAYQWKSFPDPGEFRQFSDEHGTASQRFYNTLCLAYGGDAETFREFVEQGWLPAVRAPGCKAEYQQVKEAFAATILPFINREAMKEVQGREWLKLTTAQAELLREQQLKQQPTFNFAACNLSPVSNVYVALMTKRRSRSAGAIASVCARLAGARLVRDSRSRLQFHRRVPGQQPLLLCLRRQRRRLGGARGRAGRIGAMRQQERRVQRARRHALPRGGSGGEFQTAGCGADGIR